MIFIYGTKIQKICVNQYVKELFHPAGFLKPGMILLNLDLQGLEDPAGQVTSKKACKRFLLVYTLLYVVDG